jgi:hypothetical protein
MNRPLAHEEHAAGSTRSFGIARAQGARGAAARSRLHPDGAELDDGGRLCGPSAFYLRHGAGAFHDQHWSEYARWIVSNDAVYFRSCSATLLAIEHGDLATGGRSASATRSVSEPSDATGTECASATHAASAPGPAILTSKAPHGTRPSLPSVLPFDARHHVGREVVREGEVAYVIDSGEALYLAFQRSHQGLPVVIVPRNAWSRFRGGPASYVRAGEHVRVRGRLRGYQGDPALDLLNPAQLEPGAGANRDGTATRR